MRPTANPPTKLLLMSRKHRPRKAVVGEATRARHRGPTQTLLRRQKHRNQRPMLRLRTTRDPWVRASLFRSKMCHKRRWSRRSRSESILADFNREQETFVKGKQRCDAGILPWVGCEDEENVKQQILSLSADKRNFVRSPPVGIMFEFDMDTMSPVAMALLQEDSDLEKMRFELVPKWIPETDFWRNYFYRVSLIKQSTQLSALGHGKGAGSSSSGDTSSVSSQQSPSDESNKQNLAAGDDDEALDSPTHEFVSDTFQGTKISEEEVKLGMKQLGMGDKAAAEDDWEKELQQELQDFEVVATNSAAQGDDPEWENEIQEMLAAHK
ncbi:synapse-associated protein 47kD isoform X2 [Rhipicephalus microplus]|uniref:synapse-associated protein 47kD isoform X2 n=1 Tax=Rhipicephalus microplus TaxID=6941 RepID=UPI003F6D31F8